MLNPDAIALWNSHLGSHDRVLILGASGWFGRTARVMTGLPPDQVMSVGSYSRLISLGESSFHVQDYDLPKISAFRPTVILDFWFLTREKIEKLGEERYERLVDTLIERTLAVVALPSVSRVITISSGAAVHDDKNFQSGGGFSAYGRAKRKSEKALLNASYEKGFLLSMTRAYSVSGALVTRPRDYAFSDLALQSLEGRVCIRSSGYVRRSYVAVEDLLAVSLGGLQKGLGILSSGGELIEIGDLPRLFARVLSKELIIERAQEPPHGVEDNYFATDGTWQLALDAIGHAPLDIRQQAENLLSYFSLPRSV